MARPTEANINSIVQWMSGGVGNLGLLAPRRCLAIDFLEELPTTINEIAVKLRADCDQKGYPGELMIAKMILDAAVGK